MIHFERALPRTVIFIKKMAIPLVGEDMERRNFKGIEASLISNIIIIIIIILPLFVPILLSFPC